MGDGQKMGKKRGYEAIFMGMRNENSKKKEIIGIPKSPTYNFRYFVSMCKVCCNWVK
jgi:hypothetical protein